MATVAETAPKANGLTAFFQSPQGRYLALGAGMALVVSIMASIWMWNQKPEYRGAGRAIFRTATAAR